MQTLDLQAMRSLWEDCEVGVYRTENGEVIYVKPLDMTMGYSGVDDSIEVMFRWAKIEPGPTDEPTFEIRF